MKLLLDTHIWLWSVANSERLSRRLFRAINDPRNELWISPISTWEIVVLYEKGRLITCRWPGIVGSEGHEPGAASGSACHSRDRIGDALDWPSAWRSSRPVTSGNRADPRTDPSHCRSQLGALETSPGPFELLSRGFGDRLT